MRAPVLQDRLPHVPWMDPATARLPGMRPCGAEDWLRMDEAYAGQMAERDWLIATRQPLVNALLPEGRAAAAELLDMVLELLARREGFAVRAASVTRPDGVVRHLGRGVAAAEIGDPEIGAQKVRPVEEPPRLVERGRVGIVPQIGEARRGGRGHGGPRKRGEAGASKGRRGRSAHS